MHPHELRLDLAEKEIHESGFEIVSRQDHFVHRPGQESWWAHSRPKAMKQEIAPALVRE